MTEEAQIAEESGTLLDEATPTLSEGEYFLSDGIKGTGEAPEWYKSDKYSSVAEQARAYTELEKKFGGFTGAPKDGYAGPEGVDAADGLLEELTELARTHHLNQEAFTQAWQPLTANEEAYEQVTPEQTIDSQGDHARHPTQQSK